MMTISDIPLHVQENLIAGVKPHQKRVVLNLASVSRMVNPEGKLRTYDDFVHDWEYVGSTFVIKGTCFLCGKHPIREACHMKEKTTDAQIIVGNDCVYKHMEISTDGVEGLTGDAKRDFLRLEMGRAKARFFKADFEHKYDLEQWQKVSNFFLKVHPKWRSAIIIGSRSYTSMKRATTMINNKGYLANGTQTAEWFETNWGSWDDKINRLNDSIKEREHARSRKAAEAAKVRNSRNADALAFRNIAEQLVEKGLLDSETESSIGYTENFIRNSGVIAIHRAFHRVRNCYQAVMRVSETPIKVIKMDSLTSWEKNFMESIDEWTTAGKAMSSKQQEVYDRIMKKVTA